MNKTVAKTWRGMLLSLIYVAVLLMVPLVAFPQQRDGENNIYFNGSNIGSPVRSTSPNTIPLYSGDYLDIYGAGTAQGRLRGHPSTPGIELGSVSADPLWFSTNSIERMRITSDGKVGIGTPSPGERLTLAGGNIFVSSAIGSSEGNLYFGGITNTGHVGMRFFGGLVNNAIPAGFIDVMTSDPADGLRFRVDNINGGTERMRITASGKVGIGTPNPIDQLHVVYPVNTLGLPTFETSDRNLISMGFFQKQNAIRDYGAYFLLAANTADFKLFRRTPIADTEVMTVLNSNGYVGIGTPNPGGNLDVRDSSGRQLLLTNYGGVHSFLNSPVNAHLSGNLYWDTTNWNRFDTSRGGALVDARGDQGVIDFMLAGAGSNPVGNFTTAMRIDNNGRVGIDTLKPGYKLDVQNGSINASGGLCIAGDCKTAWPQLSSQWNTSPTSPDINYSNGNVGIGTSSPDGKLEVKGQGRNGTAVFWGTNNASVFNQGSIGEDTFIRGGKSTSRVWLNDGGDVMISSWSGNVGIGTGYDRPTAKVKIVGNGTQTTLQVMGDNGQTALQVVGDGKFTGNLTVDGNLAAKYQDLAEWVPSSDHFSAGTVVVLDSTTANQVTSSSQTYDTRVAGVVSAQPGITLGDKGDHKVLVATTGRVRVKVDASKSPIQIGDLLVTSDIPGYAMKSEPIMISGRAIHAPGTLIGKALEPLAKGKGEILVLLSLQ